MTDETPNPTTPDAQPDAGLDATHDAGLDAPPDDGQDPKPGARPGPASDAGPETTPDAPPGARPSSATDVRAHRPEYKGAELDPERGPGLGCFWFQLITLGFFIVLIPIGLKLGWPYELLAILLFVVIGLLLLTGQSVIFLLRLVAADRRAQGRRRPLASSTKTVGEIEDEHRVAHAVGGARRAEPPPADEPPADEPPAAEPPADEPPADEPPAVQPPADEPSPQPAAAAATPPEGAGERTGAASDSIAERESMTRAEPMPVSRDEVAETLPAGSDGAAQETPALDTSADGGEGTPPGPDRAGAAEPSAPPTRESSTDGRQAGSDPEGASADEPDRTPDEPLSGALGQSPEEHDPGVPQ